MNRFYEVINSSSEARSMLIQDMERGAVIADDGREMFISIDRKGISVIHKGNIAKFHKTVEGVKLGAQWLLREGAEREKVEQWALDAKTGPSIVKIEFGFKLALVVDVVKQFGSYGYANVNGNHIHRVEVGSVLGYRVGITRTDDLSNAINIALTNEPGKLNHVTPPDVVRDKRLEGIPERVVNQTKDYLAKYPKLRLLVARDEVKTEAR